MRTMSRVRLRACSPPGPGRHLAVTPQPRQDDTLPAALPAQFLDRLARRLLLVDELFRPCYDLLRDVWDERGRQVDLLGRDLDEAELPRRRDDKTTV